MKRKAVLGIMLTLLFMGILSLTFDIQQVEASGTITIKADGSIEGTTDIMTVDNVTYTLTDNIFNQSIIVERDNVVVDGAGYTLQGTGDTESTGIDLTGRRNVTIQNTRIEEFSALSAQGIMLDYSLNNTISGNNITNNYVGILLEDASGNRIYGNNMTDNGGAISLRECIYNTISENVITDNFDGISILGLYFSGNTVSRNKIASNYGKGIHIGSNGDTISENNITENLWGISCRFSNNCTISGNNITANEYLGIWLYQSSNNIVSENNVTNNQGEGINIYKSFNNTISGNFMANNTEEGVYLLHSSNNVVAGNIIKNNSCAIWLGGESSGNFIYHNEFWNNAEQVHSSNATNVWDDGVGKGNYWSDYEDRYPNATELDGTGIWGTPYVIDANNQDNYPLVPEFPLFIVTPLFMIATLLMVMVYRRKHSM